MKLRIFLISACIVVISGRPRSKREAYELPDGADLLVGNVKTSFACPQGAQGYFADMDNNCQIFHVCNTQVQDDGTQTTDQFSFLCGNQTVFNQYSQTCAMPEEAIPCPSSADFFYLNDNVRLGDPNVPFLTDDDVARAAPLIQGAAARAAEPSRPLRG